MVRFGAKKVETSPPFLFSKIPVLQDLYSFSLVFIIHLESKSTLTQLQGFKLKAFLIATAWNTFGEP